VEETDSTSSQTEKSNTWEEGTTTSTEESKENCVEASVSGGGFGVSVSSSVSSCSTSTQSEENSSTKGGSDSSSNSTENSITNSLTRGSQTSYGYSQSNSDSVTNTNSVGSSKTATLTKTFSTNICNTKSSTTDVNTDNQESTDKSEDLSFQKSYEIPGDMRSIKNSIASVETDNFFAKTSGSISHTEATCETYSAKMDPSRPPAFSNIFKEKVLHMAKKTEELWPTNVKTFKSNGTILSYLTPENQKIFDKLFSDFIENFGTHFIQSAKIGAVMRIEEEMASRESKKVAEAKYRKCFELRAGDEI